MDKLRRFNPWPIFLYNSRAMRGPDSERLTWAERALLYGTPAVGFVVFVVFRLQLGGIAQLLSATSLLVGAMLSTFVFLANLRIKIQEVPEYRIRAGLKELVASSAVGALHVSLMAMLLALGLALMASWPLLTVDGIPGNIASSLCVALLIHLVISLAAVLRRLFAIYEDLFKGDFLAKPMVEEPEPRRGKD